MTLIIDSRLLIPSKKELTISELSAILAPKGYNFILTDAVKKIQSITPFNLELTNGDIIERSGFPSSALLLERKSEGFQLTSISSSSAYGEQLLASFLSDAPGIFERIENPNERFVIQSFVKKIGNLFGLTTWEPSDILPRNIVYDVALSYAREQEQYVERVYKHLKEKKQQLRIFRDSEQEATLWGKDMAEYFDDVFSAKSLWCIMFVSDEYIKKMWTSHERRSALAKQLKTGEYILPVRFSGVIVPGLSANINYQDAAKKNPEEIADLFLRKFDENEASIHTEN